MHLKATILLAFAALSTAFTVPEGQPDGIYVVDANGTIIESLPSAPISKRQTPFPITEIGCTGAILNTGDAEAGARALGTWCDRGNQIPARGWVYQIAGSAIVYGCSYGGSNPCSGVEFFDAVQEIFSRCGWGRSGYLWAQDWAKTYGIDHANANFCTNL